MGEKCGINRVHKLMKQGSIKAQVGYRKPRHRGGNQHVVVPHLLQREFNPDAPNTAWVTDITYIKTQRGLALLGSRLRLVLTKDHWLVNAIDDDKADCIRCSANGGLAQKTDD